MWLKLHEIKAKYDRCCMHLYCSPKTKLKNELFKYVKKEQAVKMLQERQLRLKLTNPAIAPGSLFILFTDPAFKLFKSLEK